MASYNFSATCDNVSTADIEYPQATSGIMILVSFAVTFLIFFSTSTFLNLSRSDLVTKTTEFNEEKAKQVVKGYDKMFDFIWTIIIGVFVIVVTCLTWYFYSVQIDGAFSVPKDFGAIYITAATALLIVVWSILRLRDLAQKYDTKNAKVLQQVTAMNTVYQYEAVNGDTRSSHRLVILFFNNAVWATIPVVLATRTSNYMPSLIYGFVLANGIIVSLTFTLHNFYIIRNLWIGYLKKSSLNKGPLTLEDIKPIRMNFKKNNLNNVKYPSPKLYIVGFETEILGSELFFKGMIPTQYLPEPLMWAVISFYFAWGYAAYNDQIQAVTLGLVSMLAFALTYAGKYSETFIAWQTVLLWTFYIVNYTMQLLYPNCDTEDKQYNYLLMTLRQNALTPGDTTLDSFGVSIYFAVIVSFCWSIIAMLLTMYQVPIPPTDNQLEE